jgi:hypothetical protein
VTPLVKKLVHFQKLSYLHLSTAQSNNLGKLSCLLSRIIKKISFFIIITLHGMGRVIDYPPACHFRRHSKASNLQKTKI